MKKQNVFVTTSHPGDAFAYLKEHANASGGTSNEPMDAASLRANLADKVAVVSVLEDRYDAAVFDAFPNLKIVANVAVGFDNIDVAAATKRGVLVLNTPGVLDAATADLAFALLLAVTRRIVEADKFVRNGEWTHWTTDLLLGTGLENKTLGIVGLGRIGQAVARRAAGFDMNVVYSQRNRAQANIEESTNAQYVPLDELLNQSDFITLHCPLNDQTRHLIGAEQFAQMKPNSFLINTARGAIVDERALVAALQAGKIKGAGLDVFAHEPNVPAELLNMNNVVLAPHIGSATTETRAAMARLAAEGVVSALAGKKPSNLVNPDCWQQFSKDLAATV